MKGVTSNIITFSDERTFLTGFLDIVLRKESRSHIILSNRLLELIHTLVSKAPSDYTPSNSRPGINQMRFNLPDWSDTSNEIYFYLTKNSQKIIEDFTYRKFWMLFDLHMDKLKGLMQFKLAIYNFMEQYEIPEEKYEMLKKRNYRDRNAITSEKTKNISSVFNRNMSFGSPVKSL